MSENIGTNPTVVNPMSKLGAEAALLKRWGAGPREIRVAVAKAPETVLADAMENVKSGQEAYTLIERGSKPKDHHEEIEAVSAQMGLTRNEKGKKIEPAANSLEAKRREQFAQRANLLNEFQQKGFDGIGDGKNPDDPASDLDKVGRQAYLVEQVRQVMLSDPNYTEIFGKLSPTAQDKYIKDQLRTNHKVLAGKIETYLAPRLQNAEFTSVDTDKAFFDDRAAKRAITEAQEPGKQIEDRIADKKTERTQYETDYNADVTEARTHASDDRILMRKVSPLLEDLNKKYIAAYTAAQTDPTQLVLVNTLGAQINQIRANPDFIAADYRLNLVHDYDTQMRQCDKDIRELESQKRLESEKIAEAKDKQIQTHDSLERMQKERSYREQQCADGIIADTLGQAFLDLEYDANNAQIEAVSARIPVEEQELAAKRTEVQRAAVAGANDYLDKRWKRERRIPGITQAREWKNRAKRSIIEQWDSLTDPERERFESASQKTFRLELVEDDYQRTINLNNGVDKVMAKFVTSVPGGAAGNKTFAELNDAIPEEKKLKDALRNAALRRTVFVRYHLSAILGKNTGEPPRQVTAVDRNKIMSRSWIDKAVLHGIETEQGARALSEANPNIPGDKPVSAETINKAKAGDKAALETVKQKMKFDLNAFMLVLGLSSAAISMGSSMLKEDQGGQRTA